MRLTTKDLKECFNNAIKEDAKYIGIKKYNYPYNTYEVVMIPREEFKEKLEEYINKYDESLLFNALVEAASIREFTYGDSPQHIINELMQKKMGD